MKAKITLAEILALVTAELKTNPSADILIWSFDENYHADVVILNQWDEIQSRREL